MFAVIRTGGKQHRVAENDRIVVERLNAEPGDLVAFDKVLMLAEDGKELLVGSAVPGEARVFGRVLEQTRGPKLIIFKKKRRKNHRRTKGHRQDLTAVRIASISPTGDAAAAEAAEPEPASKPEPIPEQEVAVAESALPAREPEPALQE
jgi:large subunit ribosomal protein L21